LLGVKTLDVNSTLAACGLLLLASLVACFLAAIRPMRVDRVEGLKAD